VITALAVENYWSLRRLVLAVDRLGGEVLAELGFGPAEIAKLRESGALIDG
jgi:hypothetical protein